MTACRVTDSETDKGCSDVDTNLVGTGKIARAAILGQQGGVWATSAGYEVRPFCVSVLTQGLG